MYHSEIIKMNKKLNTDCLLRVVSLGAIELRQTPVTDNRIKISRSRSVSKKRSEYFPDTEYLPSDADHLYRYLYNDEPDDYPLEFRGMRTVHLLL